MTRVCQSPFPRRVRAVHQRARGGLGVLVMVFSRFCCLMAATEPAPADGRALIPLIRNEIGRLLIAVVAPIHKVEYVLQWSTWRRQHRPEPAPASTPVELPVTTDLEVSRRSPASRRAGLG